MEKSTVYVVHCVDTEGPLEEILEATFERLRKEKKIDLEPSLGTLRKLQNREIPLNGEEEDVAEYLAPARLAYLSTWKELEEMIIASTEYSYRLKHASPDGSLYTYSWFIIDVIGYKDNPRRKATGFHTIWDKYTRMLKDRSYNDAFGWHFHTVPPTQNALHYNTSWTNNDFHEQVLARRVIERHWFPVLFRSGGVIERNDINYWLERFIPFDYSNQNNKYADFYPGSQSDWRHSTMRWGSYHPSFYDYRKEGNMKRCIFRCLDVKAPGCKIDEEEVQNAFKQAKERGSSIFAYTNHDRRDIRFEVEYIHALINKISKNFPEVDWQYTNATDAARKFLKLKSLKVPKLTLSLDREILYINSNMPSFTGDIFVAIEEEDLFYRDNATIESETSWAYFSPRWQSIKKIGVAITTADGQSAVNVLNITR